MGRSPTAITGCLNFRTVRKVEKAEVALPEVPNWTLVVTTASQSLYISGLEPAAVVSCSRAPSDARAEHQLRLQANYWEGPYG